MLFWRILTEVPSKSVSQERPKKNRWQGENFTEVQLTNSISTCFWSIANHTKGHQSPSQHRTIEKNLVSIRSGSWRITAFLEALKASPPWMLHRLQLIDRTPFQLATVQPTITTWDPGVPSFSRLCLSHIVIFWRLPAASASSQIRRGLPTLYR